MKKLVTQEMIAAKIDGPIYEIYGAYKFSHPKIKNYIVQVIASDGLGWDHVSVTLHELVKSRTHRVKRTPTWGEMSWVKDIFFDAEEWVIQFHPAHSEYVNNHPYCLHLWRPHADFPKPLKEMVGGDFATTPTYQLD